MLRTRKTASVLLMVISGIFVFGAFANPPFLRPLLGMTCHRLPQRTFPWAPGLCARCSFFWIGVLASSLLMFFSNLPGSLKWGILLIMPMALDGSMQYLGFYESTNTMRLITGFLAGAGLCVFFESRPD